MRTTSSMRAGTAAAIAVAAGLLGACSAHIEAGSNAAISKEQLAKTVKEKLEAQVGEKADSVVCDGTLPAKVDATQKCVLTAGGTKYGVTATATAVNGDKVNFDVKVDDEPMG
ncbi:DUF4333 domain-containing protein [Mycolicibacterium peregrinum]|uniref:DUF4333 domain-containing protein n=2 Tax=Mycolicibacterium peregrinum TaxID=43304 RepID=A0A4Z0HVU1_MYCPR|nr:DUF4333 domain-containing protein [Mycolicibacterium peregrinum]TGB47457.1 DUF4333 domain-containing protein [Mycolicibacterium peregrinum]